MMTANLAHGLNHGANNRRVMARRGHEAHSGSWMRRIMTHLLIVKTVTPEDESRSGQRTRERLRKALGLVRLVVAGLTGLVATGPALGASCFFPLDFFGTQYEDCMACASSPVWDRCDLIVPGMDLGQEKAPLEPHTALNLIGQSPPNTIWLTLYAPSAKRTAPPLFGDATYHVAVLNSEINGEKCGCVFALVTPHTDAAPNQCGVGTCVCDGKGTDFQRIGLVNTTTGAWTNWLNTNLSGAWDTYAGTTPPANCDHNRQQLDWHMYCGWARVEMDVLSNADGTITITGRSYRVGAGDNADPSRNDPNSPEETLMGSDSVTMPRPACLAAIGQAGVGGKAMQARMEISLRDFKVAPTSSQEVCK